MRSRTGRLVLAGLLTAAVFLTAACTSANSAVTGCHTTCRGTIDGAAYAIKVPDKWNGTLLLYSHGYRNDTGDGPGPAVLTQTDRSGDGSDRVGKRLLAEGYALAGSSYDRAGWAVADALSADSRLYERFVHVVGKPRRVYAVGSSMGGLISVLLAERASWVDGAAPMCGVVAGPLLNFDNFLAAALGVRTLIAPQLQVGGWGDATAALANLQAAGQAVETAAADATGGGAAKVLYLAARLGLPTVSQHAPGTTPESMAQGAAESLVDLLEGGTAIRYQTVPRFRGDGSLPAAMAPNRVSAGMLAAVRAMHGHPELYARELAAAVAPPAAPAARAALRASGDPTGRLRVPTVTLHTESDPLAIVANETVLRERVAAAGRSRLLRQFFVVPPAGYNPATGPRWGIRHCSFSDDQMVGLVSVLDTWVRSGRAPTAASVEVALGGGIDPSFRSPAWPDAIGA